MQPISDPGVGTRPQPLALVTGASSGIGREVAIALAKRGYRTILIARRAPLLATLADTLNPHALSVSLALDLADTDALPRAITPLLDLLGPVSVLVNCAGFGFYKPLLEHSTDELRRLMAVNHEAALVLARLVLPGMLSARQGHVFAVCSMAARIGPWGHAGYAASKGAMRSVMECLAAEHPARATGVRFTTVFPGIIDTPYFCLGGMDALWPLVRHRAITPARVAEAICGSISRDRLHLYVPRHYRALTLIEALSPALAHALVRRGSTPRFHTPVPAAHDPLPTA